MSGDGGTIWLTPDAIKDQRDKISFSTAEIAEGQTDSEYVLVDTIVLNSQAELTRTTKEIRDLARILSKSDPLVFGLLRCLGVAKRAEIQGNVQLVKFELMFSPQWSPGPDFATDATTPEQRELLAQ